MSVVPAHTSQIGEFTRRTYHETKEYMFDGSVRVWPDSHPSAYSLKPSPNKAPYHRAGYKENKGYIRWIARCNRQENWLFKITRPDGKAYIGSFPLIGNLMSSFPPDIGDTSYSNENEAIAKALNKLRGSRTLQLGADLAEGRKTVDMIAGNFTSLLKAYSSAKRGRWRDTMRHLGLSGKEPSTKLAANKWLELQYGWLPLMGTIHDGTEILREGFSFPSTSRVARVVASATHEWDLTRKEGGGANASMTDGMDRRLVGKQMHKYGLYFQVANANVASLDAAGVLNPMSIAWELVPFSFVVDWFVPVGKVLSALTATAGLTFVDGYRIDRWHMHEYLVQRPFQSREDPSGYTHSFLYPGMYHSEMFHFSRRQLTSWPTPGLYASKRPFSTKRTKNALALLRQLL